MNPINDSGIFALRKADGKSLKMLFTGDLGASEKSRERFARKDFDAMFGAFKPLMQPSDLRIVNVELPLVDAEIPTAKLMGQSGMHAPKEVLDALVYMGVDVANLANNHVTDQGPAGVQSTLDLLRGAGIKSFGAGMNEQEAAKPLVIERNGFRTLLIGMVTDENNIAGPSKAGANLFTPERLVEAVKRWRPECDVLIANVHAGTEHTPVPDPYRVRAFRAAVDTGADVVIGHHPHVPQGCEVYNGRLIVYSLGNFYFYLKGHRRVAPMAPLTYSIEVEVDRKGLVGARVVPHQTTEEEELLPQDDATRKLFMRRLHDLSSLLEDDARRERLYNAGCWLLWRMCYIPWVVEKMRKSEMEECFHFLAGWTGMLSFPPHSEVVHAVFRMERSGGVNEADLRELEQMRQRPQ